ncbi:hypothetical protein CPB83DRAFT_898867 [Crepidotus variabilis]|uniref:Uncharacterized protein n=1 Tax=Crepidotus variabilis TaxID=179855 RepID=A0A9P6JK18_9AGAR|nr:hypothetical protein CPB83DRAFT_898867 [Crepidotus variabilis]
MSTNRTSLQNKSISSSGAIKLVPRQSQEDRINADHGWLKTFLTFTFALAQEDDDEEKDRWARVVAPV